MAYYLSFLMSADHIQDSQLKALDIEIVEKASDGDRKLKIPLKSLSQYLDLIKTGLTPGFWNEVVGPKEITFIFKFKDGTIEEYKLSSETEIEISKLCTQFNNDPLEKTSNIYRYISGNNFYHDFMVEHYSDSINRL